MKTDNVRDVIKYIREKEGISRYALAQILNTTTSRVKAWEEGETVPGINVIDNILHEFSYTFLVEKK